MAGLLDLETQFAFYGAYHSAPLNILIHAIFVWPIFFTGLLFLYFTPPIVQIAIPFELPLVLNFGFVFALAYAVYYFCLDRRAGSAGALLCFLCWIGSSFLGNRLGRQRSFQVASASQLFCWIWQFIGHGVFEGRAPALLTNLPQAFLMAPFFVLLEVLRIFNYEPYPGFNASVQSKVDADREAWKASKNKKSS